MQRASPDNKYIKSSRRTGETGEGERLHALTQRAGCWRTRAGGYEEEAVLTSLVLRVMSSGSKHTGAGGGRDRRDRTRGLHRCSPCPASSGSLSSLRMRSSPCLFPCRACSALRALCSHPCCYPVPPCSGRRKRRRRGRRRRQEEERAHPVVRLPLPSVGWVQRGLAQHWPAVAGRPVDLLRRRDHRAQLSP